MSSIFFLVAESTIALLVDVSTILYYAHVMTLKSEDILTAWATLFEAHGLAVQQVESEISEKASLSLAEYDILLTVARAQSARVRYSDLARASLFTKSGITRLVKRMEQQSYLKRVQCESDGRGAYAELTAAGREALASTWKLYSAAVQATLGPALSQSDACELARILEKVIRHLRPKTLVTIKKRCIE